MSIIDAIEYVGMISSMVILMDGETLAGPMVDYNVDATRGGVYEMKKLDADYFEGE